MALSLVVASVAWAGFVLSRTVLDPGRSERLADHLLENDDVRSVLVTRLADAVEATIPDNTPVPRNTIELAAAEAVDDPRVEAVLRDGIVRTHQNALNGVDEPVTLDASVLGTVGREKVVESRPQLDTILPAVPQVPVELPATGLSWLGSVRNAVDRFTRIAGAVSLIGMASAFLLARNRPAALRRVAYWGFGASAFWIAMAYAIPAVLARIAPSSVSIASAVIDVFFGAMIPPAIILVAISAGLLGLSVVWPALTRRRPAAMLDRAPRPRPGPTARPAMAHSGPRPMVAHPGPPPRGVTDARHLGGPPGSGGPWVDNVQAWPVARSDDPTQVWRPGLVESRPVAQTAHDPGWVDPDAATQIWSEEGDSDQAPGGAGWIEGVGYVEGSDGHRPPGR
jgi:hypothetical protein